MNFKLRKNLEIGIYQLRYQVFQTTFDQKKNRNLLEKSLTKKIFIKKIDKKKISRKLFLKLKEIFKVDF